ncbi:hypothetical protein F5J12DRAFT_895030 [Pisolithus orientalis]|uniref:uncharacterized protein n=1 Tax=Pisolithus orientalis TaxID=936130 RepID=UPI00222416AE|nr:uncharacterized protein F5J12DRAFT_895030 [Pisolithus orientalis]KAI5999782.1 hypothetical protein F5J12DRAFT_895030 [Pisolithus orientalis]
MLRQTGAGWTYDDLASNTSTKNIIDGIQKEFLWWGDLHGWWHTNPAYNSMWSGADSGQNFATHAVRLFKLQLNPHAISDGLPVPGSPVPLELEEGEIGESSNLIFADNSLEMTVDYVGKPPIPLPSFAISHSSLFPSFDQQLSPAVLSPPPILSDSSSHATPPFRSEWPLLAIPSPSLFRNQLSIPSVPPFVSDRGDLSSFALPSPLLFGIKHPLLGIPSPPPLIVDKGDPISLNDDPTPFVSCHPKIQPMHPSLEHNSPLLKPRLASTPNTDESSDSDMSSSNLFLGLRMSSSSTVLSDDSNCKPSSSKLSCKHGNEAPADQLSVQQDQLEHKCSQMDFNYWKVKERKSAHDYQLTKWSTDVEDHEHQLQMQCKLHAHEQAMVAQEVEKMKLAVQLEQLCVQNLTLQKGIAGGEDQGTSSDSQNIHLTF